MGGLQEHVYEPIPQNVEIYERLYADYLRLYNYFGLGESGLGVERGHNDVMKRLRALRRGS